MRRPTETALKSRARALLEAMTSRARWIYAVPRDDGLEAVRAIAIASGLRASDDETRFENEARTASIAVRDEPELEVLIIEARGEASAEILAKILEQAGFYAQSTLLGTAFDVDDEEAADALGTLAHMVAVWDDGWRDLFAIHLGAADPAVRRRAVEASLTAALAAGAPGPLPKLLEDARSSEKDEAIRESMVAACRVLTPRDTE